MNLHFSHCRPERPIFNNADIQLIVVPTYFCCIVNLLLILFISWVSTTKENMVREFLKPLIIEHNLNTLGKP